jgi:hypothetical protein
MRNKLISTNLIIGALLIGENGFSQFVSMKQFCQDIEGVFCRKNTKDCSQADSRKHQCMEFLNPLLEQKAIRYRLDQSKSCIQATQNPHTSCGQVFEGMLGPNQACEWSVSCRRPLVCVKQTGSLKGACSMPLKKASPCEKEAYTGSLYIQYLVSLNNICTPGTQCEDVGGGIYQCR